MGKYGIYFSVKDMSLLQSLFVCLFAVNINES